MNHQTVTCRITGCEWAEVWSTHDAAGCAGTHHVYIQHPDEWRRLFGDRPPDDPKPETVGERIAP